MVTVDVETTRMIHFKNEDLEVTTATTIEGVKQVLVQLYCVTQKDGIMLFRGPKRFLQKNSIIINAKLRIINLK